MMVEYFLHDLKFVKITRKTEFYLINQTFEWNQQSYKMSLKCYLNEAGFFLQVLKLQKGMTLNLLSFCKR